MVKITIEMDDKIFKDLLNAVMVRQLTASAYGILDAFNKRLVEKIQEGAEHWEVKRAKDK